MAKAKTGVKVKSRSTRSVLVAEYPLSSPYGFEGFAATDEMRQRFGALLASQPLQASGVGVVRAGGNAYGTWGYLAVWEGGKWVAKGYTLEPRSGVGKGPIPLGDYPFNRWVSPRLAKTLRLSNVPGFTDILIHVGNSQDDTVGCILAGKKVDRLDNPTRLVDSRTLVDWLYDTQPQGLVLVRSG